MNSTAYDLAIFFNDTATTEIYTLSLHDALPICVCVLLLLLRARLRVVGHADGERRRQHERRAQRAGRSEEHTSELQSRQYLVCRLLLEKKTKNATFFTSTCSCARAARLRLTSPA